MFREITIAVALMGFFAIGALFTSTSYGETADSSIIHDEHAAISQTSTSKAEAVGNKFCPVSGEEIDQKTAVTYEYNGKIYSFCCQACIDEFKKDPEKYIEGMKKELDTRMQEQSSHEERK